MSVTRSSKHLLMTCAQIFSTDPSTYISITAHGGTIQSFFRVVGHQPISVGPGGFVPVVVKATKSVQLLSHPISETRC